MKIQTSNLNFQAGLTLNMQREIKTSDVQKISHELAKMGINNDFKGNKVIAWCAHKCCQIINDVNKKYRLKLGLPKGIFVEDFNKLVTPYKESFGMCNFAPTNLYIGSSKVVPEKTIFFNEFKKFNHNNGNCKWDMLDSIADNNYEDKISPTDFFLDVFMHEFSHVIHENNAVEKLGGKRFVKETNDALTYFNIQSFQRQNKAILDSICKYAAFSPFEAVACDFTKRILENIDKNFLTVQNNFIKKSPYENQTIFTNLFDYKAHDKQFKLLKHIWNGRFN